MRRVPEEGDTICAISTPPGLSGVGIIRVSGPRALEMAQAVYLGPKKFNETQTHTAIYGKVFDPLAQKVLDEALFLVMKKPRSYTGEDVVEIQTHGSPFILQKGLALLARHGARLARPGEFTRRAFLSGRIDLAQAEAVMEMISSQNQEHHQWALGQLRGALSRRVTALRQRLLGLLARIEASIDFSEEGISFGSDQELEKEIISVRREIQQLLERYEEGRQIRDGFTVVIVGRPNVGKSSLMNLLLQEERAIVTPFPGTTRDLLEEWLHFDGMSIKIVDTAGYRQTSDPIEAEGVRRGEAALMKGDLSLWMLDASEPLQKEDQLLLERMGNEKKVIILNKADLPRRIDLAPIKQVFPSDPVVSLSTLTGEGLEEVRVTLRELLVRSPEREPPLVALLRHRKALERSEEALGRAFFAVQGGASWEFLAVDLREGADALGEIVGEVTTDAILDEIFSQFCIGK